MENLRNIVMEKLDSIERDKKPFMSFSFENEIYLRFDCPKFKDRISTNFVSIVSAKKIKYLIDSIEEVYERCHPTPHIDLVTLSIEDYSVFSDTYSDLFFKADVEYNQKVLVAKSKLYCEVQDYADMLTEIIRIHLIVQDSIHSLLNSN